MNRETAHITQTNTRGNMLINLLTLNDEIDDVLILYPLKKVIIVHIKILFFQNNFLITFFSFFLIKNIKNCNFQSPFTTNFLFIYFPRQCPGRHGRAESPPAGRAAATRPLHQTKMLDSL